MKAAQLQYWLIEEALDLKSIARSHASMIQVDRGLLALRRTSLSLRFARKPSRDEGLIGQLYETTANNANNNALQLI